MQQFLTDQQALSFLVQQASYVETEVDEVDYPEIQYPDLIPVDFSAGEWTKTITRFVSDKVGQAQWFNHLARDVPRADVSMNKLETIVEMAAIGYGYTMEELAQAQMLSRQISGYRLDTARANAARFAYEKFVDNFLMFGDVPKGIAGLTNYPTLAASMVAATGTGGSTLWANKTPDQQLSDVNAGLVGIYTGTNEVEWADTVLLPYSRLLNLGDVARGSSTDTTILQFLLKANAFTAVTGRPLTVRGVRGLDTAGAGGSARMVVYRRDERVLKAHIPMRHKFLDPMRT
ncbi:MAG: DUF2184 domain-containing protein, partial [Janthinobacterium lividum]